MIENVSLVMPPCLNNICKNISIIAVFHFVLKELAKELKHIHACHRHLESQEDAMEEHPIFE